jgi:cell division protein YceG involved in septum cleavage
VEDVITIPEGYTLKEIDALLADKKLIKAGDLVACSRDCRFDREKYPF